MSPAALMSIIAGKAQAAATGVTATINAPIELASLIQGAGRLLGTGQCLPIWQDQWSSDCRPLPVRVSLLRQERESGEPGSLITKARVLATTQFRRLV